MRHTDLRVVERNGIKVAEVTAQQQVALAPNCPWDASRHEHTSWYGGTREDALQSLSSGNAEILAMARKAQAALSTLPIPSQMMAARGMKRDACGGALSVPRAIVGHPLAFSRPAKVPALRGVRLWVNGFVSGSYLPEEITQRQVAITALAQYLNRIGYPVEVHQVVTDTNTNTALVSHLRVSPPDWAALASLGSSCVMRRITFGILSWVGQGDGMSIIHWANVSASPWCDALGIGPRDLVISGMLLGMTSSGAIAGWVREQAKKVRGAK